MLVRENMNRPLNEKTIANLYKAINSLKNMPRQGWVIEGVPKAFAEDVAQHSYEVAITSLILSIELKKKGYNIDLEKVLAMAILHDLSEAFIGDIVKYTQKYIGNLKEEAEINSLREFIDIDYFINIHKEYLEGKVLEAAVVKISDLMATAIQASRYYNVGYRDVERILENTKEKALKIAEEISLDIKEIVTRIFNSLSIK